MKTTKLLLVIPFILMGCQIINAQSKASNLPVFDFSKNYPQKKMRLQEMADIEYVPSPTNISLYMKPGMVTSLFSIVIRENFILTLTIKGRVARNTHGSM